MLTMIPFNPESKLMIVAYKTDEIDANSEPIVKIFVKGAPEKVLECCSLSVDASYRYENLDDGYDSKQRYEKDYIEKFQK